MEREREGGGGGGFFITLLLCIWQLPPSLSCLSRVGVCCACSRYRYYCFDASKSLRDNLDQKFVVEYPSVWVVLPGQEDGYRVVEPGKVSSSFWDAFVSKKKKMRRQVERVTLLLSSFIFFSFLS